MTQALVAENLSKMYRLGKMRHETMLRDALAKMFRPSARRDGGDQTFWALKEVSFSVDQGEVVGIVGRNGAGKSTLLKLLSRITYPTSGRVKVRGRVASLVEVGTGFHQELTGRENIYLNGSIMGMKKKDVDSKLEQIIDFSGISQFIDTPIKRYSSGMRLRLGFAVAAHLDPDVFLVDEVLAVGDVSFQKKCLDTMDDLRTGGRTVLFVSHNMEAVENLCPRVLWIDQGRIRRDGDSTEVIREYLSTFAHPHQSDLDLAAYEHRRGTGEAIVTGVDFLTPDGKPKDLIRSGDGIVMRLQYRAKRRIKSPHFGFRLTTDMGTMITDLSTWSTGLDIPYLAEGEGSIDFEIDFLNLMPGRFYVSLWIQGHAPLVHYDILDNCMEFNVEASNYYQSGRGIGSKFGLMFFPCRWRLPETVSK